MAQHILVVEDEPSIAKPPSTLSTDGFETVWATSGQYAVTKLPSHLTRVSCAQVLRRPNSGQKSTGLGLPFVREIAHLHGGEIVLKGTLEGAATLTLPKIKSL